MHGQEERVRFLRSLARRTGACIALGVACQSLEFVVAPRVAEYDFMSSSREAFRASRPSIPNPGCRRAHRLISPFDICCSSAAHQFLQFFGVPSALHRDL